MSIKTNLSGRLRNTSLPLSHGLMPLFEAVVNSIHAIEEVGQLFSQSQITVEIVRSTQASLALNPGAENPEKIVGFRIIDNGIGFNDENMKSFETLDTDHKAEKGCRGVGRLLWLKAFRKAEVESVFKNAEGRSIKRNFSFDEKTGLSAVKEEAVGNAVPKTTISLIDFDDKYRATSVKKIAPVARSLLEHCLWYFVRDGGCPKIKIVDGDESIDLDSMYDEYMHASATKDTIKIKETPFEITHLKFRASSASTPTFSFCAASRLAKEENLAGKIPGISGTMSDEKGDFVYSCYVSSPYLDEKVRSERTGFNLEENVEGIFAGTEISLKDIRDAVIPTIKTHLAESLSANIAAGRKRVNDFISHKAPRYRPILSRIPDGELFVDSTISDKDLELHLHKHLAEIERLVLEEGHTIMVPHQGESYADYQARIRNYLDAVTDIKKSDLADYLCHRKVIIDLLEKSLQKDENGKYVREEMIHELIMPRGDDSNSAPEGSCNLWLIDERLTFHDYLASDKTLKSMPITGNDETKEPDLMALNVYDNPMLMTDEKSLPLASLVVVEIKRPMRNDAKAGEEKDPIEQALGYLTRVRKGKAVTATGRPIPNSQDIPGFCYVICDITETVKDRCQLAALTVTSDHMGYFGYNPNYKSYIEVISFDKLVDNAKKRNRAFFDKLGLPNQ